MRDIVFIGLAILLSGIITMAGCAGRLTDMSKEVKERRQEIAKKVGQLEQRYLTGRELYIEMRTQIKKRWDDIPDELQKKLKDFDAKAKEFDAQIIELKKSLDNANTRIKTLEQKAKEADEQWKELLTTLKNVSKILVAIA